MILDTRLNNLLSRWEQAVEKPSAEELCHDCPELLPDVRDCIRRLSSTDSVLRTDERVSEPRQPVIANYEIVRFINRGGMGEVWLANQSGTERRVALKVIAAGEFASARMRARFEREVKLASKLNHPNVAQIYDGGQSNGELYYAQEYIDGIPLDMFVVSRSLNRNQILLLICRVCDAVHHAHQLGVIHRDLKPGNILVDERGEPHLLDFGLAKAVLFDNADDSSHITRDEMPGTPAYMSPEQAAGQFARVGVASDIYSVGVILFSLLLQRFPHDVHGNAVEVMQRIATTDPADPRQIDPKFPWALRCVLKRALSRDPSQRYATATQLAEDLKAIISGMPPQHAQVGRWPVVRSFAVRRWQWLAAGAAALALAVGGVGLWLWLSTAIVVSTDGLNGQALHVAAYFEENAGHLNKAEALYRRSLAEILAAGRDDSVDALNDRSALFQILRRQGRDGEAKPFIDECERILPRKLNDERPFDAIWIYGYAESLAATGFPERATIILQNAAPLAERLLPLDDAARIRLLRTLKALMDRNPTTSQPFSTAQ